MATIVSAELCATIFTSWCLKRFSEAKARLFHLDLNTNPGQRVGQNSSDRLGSALLL
jgi:hypothetical protein